jgi:hypothetical protein
MKRAPLIHIFLVFAFLANFLGPIPKTEAQELSLPVPGAMIHLSPEFIPPHLVGLTIHLDNPLQFDFLVHKGEESLSDSQKKDQYNTLIKYFLASLATPDEDQWVNLSPYEKDRIIKDDFGKTEMGRDLLAQDYILKQITASLIYPEGKVGKEFWGKVYAMAHEQFGATDIPVNTFNKVWIVPDEAVVYENGQSAYILKSHLKVMLEEDYLSLEKHGAIQTFPQKGKDTSKLGSTIIREVVLPELQKEVNDGKNFALLRQVYSAMILATWYKKALKESLLGKIYMDQSKVKGIDQPACRQAGISCKANEEIYQQYMKAFKKGVYNYIKEDFDKYSQQTIPRKYFSGGIINTLSQIPAGATLLKPALRIDDAQTVSPKMVNDFTMQAEMGKFDQTEVRLAENRSDAAMGLVKKVSAAITDKISGPVTLADYFEFEHGQYRALKKDQLGKPLFNDRAARELARQWINNGDDQSRNILFTAARDSFGVDIAYRAISAVQSRGERQRINGHIFDRTKSILEEVQQQRGLSVPYFSAQSLQELVQVLTTSADSNDLYLSTFWNIYDSKDQMYGISKEQRRVTFENNLKAESFSLENQQKLREFYENLERLNFYEMPAILRDLTRQRGAEISSFKKQIREAYSPVTLTLMVTMESLMDYYNEVSQEQKPVALKFIREVLKKIDQEVIFEAQKAGNKLFFIHPSSEEWMAYSMFGFYPGQKDAETWQLFDSNPKIQVDELPGKENEFIRRIIALSEISPKAAAIMMGANGLHLRVFVPEQTQNSRNQLKELDYPAQIVLLPKVLQAIEREDNPSQKSDFINALLNGLILDYYKSSEVIQKMLDRAAERGGLGRNEIRERINRIFQQEKGVYERALAFSGSHEVMGTVATFSLMSYKRAISYSELFQSDLPSTHDYEAEWILNERETIGDFEFDQRYDSMLHSIKMNVDDLWKELKLSIDQKKKETSVAVKALDGSLANAAYIQGAVGTNIAFRSSDSAMKDLGGIDFNSANLNLQIKRDGKGIPLPINQQDISHINIDGLIPIIIDIKPVTSLPILSELASSNSSQT